MAKQPESPIPFSRYRRDVDLWVLAYVRDSRTGKVVAIGEEHIPWSRFCSEVLPEGPAKYAKMWGGITAYGVMVKDGDG